jgi:protein SCO1/2
MPMPRNLIRVAHAAFCATLLAAPLPVHAADDTAAAAQWSAAAMMDDLMWNRGPIGGPFTLTDSNGRRRSSSEFRGKLMVIYFGYTSCPDVCPTDLMAIAQAIDALGADGAAVQPIFITIDPERDTPEQLTRYAAAFHPRLIALTGSADEIRAVATAFKAYYAIARDPRDGEVRVDHNGVIYLMGRDGDYLGFMPPQTDPARLTDVLRRQLEK